MKITSIPQHNFTVREQTVVNILKGLDTPINSFLNVGFRQWNDQRNHWWIKLCEANEVKWNIMEVYQPNIDDAINGGCPKDNIKLGNILDTTQYENYDCILFWHGPEHIKKDVFINALPSIEAKANKLIIFGMPLGHEPQDAAHGNPFERHESDWFVQDWQQLGYETIPVHDHQRYPHITTFKFLGNV